MTFTKVTELHHEKPGWTAFIVRLESGRLVRIASAPNGSWVASQPSGFGLRAWHESPTLAIRTFLEDSACRA